MDKHIDKIVPISAILLSFIFAMSAYHLANANPKAFLKTEDSAENSKIENAEKSLKILIVPGHDKESYGAKFGDIKELELNLELAAKIKSDLESAADFENNYQIFLTQDENDYNQTFSDYFLNNKDQINQFISDKKNDTNKRIEANLFEPVHNVLHNRANENTVFKLYGINKWANENEIDLVLHIHFNDYPRKNQKQVGKYSGFSIYIPEKQFSNHEESLRAAQKFKDSLIQNFKPSNLKIEEKTIIESQSLIAVGANNTLERPSILVEYGYIYEDFLQDESSRHEIFGLMSAKTVQAINEYLLR